jgi:hypothetical protein
METETSFESTLTILFLPWRFYLIFAVVSEEYAASTIQN